MDTKDAVTKIPEQKSFSNELEEHVDDAHVESVGVSHSFKTEPNNDLAATTGSFRESRKIRGEAKNCGVPSHGALPQNGVNEVDELVPGPTNWVPVEEYAPMLSDGGPHGSYTPTPTPTTHSISTSTGTTLKRPTKKRAPKRKPILAQPPTTTATSADISEAMSLVEDVGAGSMEILKTDAATTSRAASEEHVGGLVEKKPNSKKIKQSYGIKGTACLFKRFKWSYLYKVCFSTDYYTDSYNKTNTKYNILFPIQRQRPRPRRLNVLD